MEDRSVMTIRNYLIDLRQLTGWREYCWNNERDKWSFTPKRVTPLLLIWYRAFLQITLWLKPSTIHWAHMSLKRYFAWAAKEQLTRNNPTTAVTFIPKEVMYPLLELNFAVQYFKLKLVTENLNP